MESKTQQFVRWYHYTIYNNYMFRPCKWAIIRLLVEPVSWLYNRSLGGTRSRFTSMFTTYRIPKRYDV